MDTEQKNKVRLLSTLFQLGRDNFITVTVYHMWQCLVGIGLDRKYCINSRPSLNGWNMQRCTCQLSSNEKIVLHSREFRDCKLFAKFEPTECKFCVFFDPSYELWTIRI